MDDFALYDLVAAPVFVVGRGEDGHIRYLYSNAASCAMTGQTRAAMIGHTAEEVFGLRLGRDIMARHAEALSQDRHIAYDVTLPVGQGEVVVRNILVRRQGAGDVAVGTTLATGSRVEEARHLAREAREVEREAALSARAQKLRGPMRKYGVLIEELRRDFTDLGNGKLQIIDEIEAIGDQAYGFVREVLTYTRAIGAKPKGPERVVLSEFCAPLFATVDPYGKHGLTADPCRILIEKGVLWFVLHELLAMGLSAPGRHDIHIGCRSWDTGQVRIEVRCRTAGDAVMTDAVCQMTEVETVMRSRGGSVEMTPLADGRRCALVLPGRLIDRRATPPAQPA